MLSSSKAEHGIANVAAQVHRAFLIISYFKDIINT
jgi:hypothetical protein